MSFGLQTFNEKEELEFDSQSGVLRVVAIRRVTGSTSFSVSSPPPYTLLYNLEYPRFAYLAATSHIHCYNIGNTIYVNYTVWNAGNQGNSVSLPCTVLVLK